MVFWLNELMLKFKPGLDKVCDTDKKTIDFLLRKNRYTLTKLNYRELYKLIVMKLLYKCHSLPI